MTKIKKHQNDLFSEEDKINGIKKQIYVELTKPFREACLEFVELRHDNPHRTELEDKQELLLWAKGQGYMFKEELLHKFKQDFKRRWQEKKWNGGWS